MYSCLSKLRSDQSGLAIVEFAVSLPFFMGLTVGGIETANYANVVMKTNQITIHIADSAARMGEGNQLAVKTIKELHVNDVFEGARREGDALLLTGQHAYQDPGSGAISTRGNAKVWLSSVEPVNPFVAGTPRYRIRWQRCVGQATFMTPSYGTVANSTSVTAVGPTGRQIKPPTGGAIMLVELKYWYTPVVISGFSQLTNRELSQVASMVVRDQRNYRLASGEESTPLTNPENVTASTC
jgi:hypothetical protein